jgi:hypothetical protein
MALTRNLPSPISSMQDSENHVDKSCVIEINLQESQDKAVERESCDYNHPSDDDTSVSSSNKKRKELDHDDDSSQKKKNCTTPLTDPILDEAADEVAEESEWELILQQWNADCENISYLITA